MDIHKHLEDLSGDDLSRALNAVQFFDRYLESSTNVREELIHALIENLAHRIWTVRSKIYDLLVKYHSRTYPVLHDYLNSENEDIQHWIVQAYCDIAKIYYDNALNEIDSEKRNQDLKLVESIINRLIEVYTDVNQSNQKFFLNGLARIKHPDLLDFFSEQLNSSSWLLRSESAAGIAEIGESVVPHLKKLVTRGTRDQCYWSFKILGQLLGDKALEPFFRVINSPDYADEIRIYALSGLKQIQKSEVVEYLVRCLSNDLWVVRAQASESLIALKSRATDALIGCLSSRDSNLRFWALRTLSEVVVESDIGKIEHFIHESDQELRFYTISALAKICTHRSIEIITQCFSDEAWLIRRHAADSLIKIGEPVIQPLLSILNEDHQNQEKVFWMLQVLATLRVPAVIPVLNQLMINEIKDYRIYAARCLAQIPGQESVQVLVNSFSNDEWIVRHECYRELLNIKGIYPHLECLRKLNDQNDSIHYWCSKFLMESRRPGAAMLTRHLLEKESQEIYKIVSNMELLQSRYIEEILDSQSADLAMVQNYLSDPYKRQESLTRKTDAAILVKSIEPNDAIQISNPINPIENDGFNYFHFEQSAEFRPYEIELASLLDKMVYLGGSDLHLKVDQAPMIRIQGKIQAMSLPVISANQIRVLMRTNFSSQLQRKFCAKKQLDCSFQQNNGERFRVNLYLSHRGIEGVFRHIQSVIPSFQDLRLPEEQFERIARLESGLVLITGMTGSGKSSTLASIIGAVNQRQSKHVICIEDPIEYVHQNQKSAISHRQIGEHVDSFVDGLSACLREDPDIVLVGEMRDPETIKSVLKLAGTGHLVFSTFHTDSAPQTIEQLIQFFPPDERQNICSQLAFCLNMIISQLLVEDEKAIGRVPVLEVLYGTNAVKNMIRESKTEQLFSVMQTGGAEGMVTRDQYLKNLLNKKLITQKTVDKYRRDRINRV